MTQATPNAIRIVVTDANVLINLIHVDRLDLLAKLPGYEFVVPDHVIEEITAPDQRLRLDDALTNAWLRRESIVDVPEITLFADLHRILGAGEAACLAIATSRGWYVASDEKGAFRREALARLGQGRLLTTPGLLLMAIRGGVLSVEDADSIKLTLEQNRFRLPFRSFAELL